MYNKLKEECSVFRDLYDSYKSNEIEEDTFNWMSEHEKDCIECDQWINNSNKKFQCTNLNEDEKSIKKARFIIFVGIIILSLLAIWTSIWIFI